jgi:protein-S-isoprenylcysteine O-methyltransferase Ste14
MKFFYLAYFVCFLLFCLVIPTFRIWKKERILAITFKNTESAHDYIGKLFKLVILSAGVPAIVYCFAEDYFHNLIPFAFFAHSFELGLTLMFISIAWVMLAQMQMSSSWRIGIDYEKKTSLINIGLFNYSRNPIYLGMQGSLLGFLLVMPNIFSLVVFIIAHILMQIQTRLEEEYLEKSHGESYVDYKKKVRRWL